MDKKFLRERCEAGHYKRLEALGNNKLVDFMAKYAGLFNPKNVFVRTDSKEDADYIRQKALENNEERALSTKGHTVHFDGYFDQGRDKANTRYLLRPDEVLGSDIKSIEREEGIREVHKFFENAMKGKEMYVCFYCLGPVDSEFSLPAVQITDSSYVGHSEDMLYRSGYEQFKRLKGSGNFFRFVHSAGELEGAVSKNVDKRRMYIDLEQETVFSVNTQYAGNTVGLKKLAMRLAIKRASEEGWLTEHMFIMGVHDPYKRKRVTYFTGSFPSACGKTATAMLGGEKIVGDDIAYLRKIDGKIRVVNVERGIFGIIQDVSEASDPTIFEALTAPGEVIFSNVLVDKDNNARWLADGRPVPEGGVNFSGEWTQDKLGLDGKKVPYAHKNARYTIRLDDLKNCDKNLESPNGVEVGGIIYGGRDSDTSVPVAESFDWAHGMLAHAATIESETTAATLGKEGVRAFNLMANLDFLSVPIGRYIQNNLDIIQDVKKVPRVFHVNYFLKGQDGEYLNGVKDKHVWIKWMELRVNGEAEAIRTPIGYIPKYEDLKKLFKVVLDKEYTEEDYSEQFKIRIPECIAKIDRIKNIYHTKVFDTPHILMQTLDDQKKRLEDFRKKHGDYPQPDAFDKKP